MGAANAHLRWSQLTTGPAPVVAESPWRTGPVCIGGPKRIHYRAGRGRAPESNDRLEQRRESSHLWGLTNILKNT
jgi:hypothetical protein